MDEQVNLGLAQNKTRRIFVFSLFLLAALQLFILVINHYFIRTYAYDFGAYNFAFYDYAHLRVSPCPIYLAPYPISFLQDHFSLTLMFFAPLYWLLSWALGTYTLLFIQWGIVVFGAWATYRLIFLKTANFTLSSLSAVYYFILLGRFSSASGDCNLAVIGSALLPAFLYYFEKGKIVPMFLCFVFLIFNREDYALWLIFISIFLMVLHRKERVKLRLSTGLLMLSFLFFIIIFNFIIPGLEDENKKYTLFNFDTLGNTPLEILFFIASHPMRAFELLFVNHSGNPYYDGIKAEFYWVYFVSGGFLLLLRPTHLIPFIPLIAKKMYNDDPVRWGIESYYSVEVVSVLPVMAFWVLSSFRGPAPKFFLAWLICGLTLTVTLFEFNRMPDVKKFNFLKPLFYMPDCDVNGIYEAMKLIPDTAPVSASGRLSPHLAFRKKIYYFPRVDDAEYILVMKRNDSWPSPQEEADRVIVKLIAEGGWQILLDKNDFRLLHKKK